MDIATIQYFIEVAQELNISKAAHNLHMTQQTLSFHIQKLEEHYGTQLFLRKPKFALTHAGEVFLEEAGQILSAVRQAEDQMAAVTRSHEGRLSIGISNFPAQMIFPHVIPEYIRRWPNIRLVFPKSTMITRVKSILDCTMDLTIGIYDGTDPQIQAEFLYDDGLFILVTDRLLEQYYTADEIPALKKRSAAGADLKDFERLNWLKLSRSSHLGMTVDNLFAVKKIRPRIAVETTSLDLASSLLHLDIGAMICGRMRAVHLKKEEPALNAFPLADYGRKANHFFYALTNKSRQQPEYLKDFIALTKQAFDNYSQDGI